MTLNADSSKIRTQVIRMVGESQETVGAGPGGQSSASGKTPTLEEYGTDLTGQASEGKLDPVVGRKKEIERVIQILGRRTKNNPCLVGEPGVGKTAVTEGLAQKIANNDVPETIEGKRVISLDMGLLVAGTKYRGEFEERLKKLMDEIKQNDDIILMIDEVHTLIGAGAAEGAIDAANILKPALARGELQCIGATTLDEYRQYIERDPALERRFQPVHVPEPTELEAETILRGLAHKYESHHKLRYTDEALSAAVKSASQYISDRFLPDKAIDVMDEAGSKVRQQAFASVQATEERRRHLAELEELAERRRVAVKAEDYAEAQRIKDREQALSHRLEELREPAPSEPSGQANQLVEELEAVQAQKVEAANSERYGEAEELKSREEGLRVRLQACTAHRGGQPADSDWNLGLDLVVTQEDVAQVVAGWTGIAVEQVSATESARLMRLEGALHQAVIGQDEAVSSVAKAVRRARAGLRNPDRPIACFMFSGPTGVGKTHLCKTLSGTFFGSVDSMVRLDMSEFMEKHTVSKLIGSPPGYVGYGDGGALTEAVRRKPYTLVLFDEVEKAHPDVFNVMLQLLDDGRLTDSKGRTVSFANAMIVLTSNIGSRVIQQPGGGIGFCGNR